MFNSIDEVIADLQEGKIIILVDDEDRENEGDLICAAEKVTPEHINFMVTHGRGLVCLALTEERAQQLNLARMVVEEDETRRFYTNFTVSIEAAHGVTTGISVYDRAHTIQTAVASHASAKDLVRPGHIFPVIAKPNGVMERTGHTEASSDLARLAGLEPAAVMVEILKEDGSMARRHDLMQFAERWGLKISSIEALVRYRLAYDPSARVTVKQYDQKSGEQIDQNNLRIHTMMHSQQKTDFTVNHIEGNMLYEGGKIAVVVSRFNSGITHQLQSGALLELEALGVPASAIDVMKVPGAFELPIIAKHLAESGRYQGILALGAVIRGGTPHFEYVSAECSRGLQEVALRSGTPVAFGVLTTDTLKQAEERASLQEGNKGGSTALALIETMNLCRRIRISSNEAIKISER